MSPEQDIPAPVAAPSRAGSWWTATTWGAAVPGVVVLAVLWLVTFVRMDFAGFSQRQIDEMWQSLGSPALAADPLGSIAAMHIQPPGLNTLYALDIALTPSRHLLLAAFLLVSALLTVVVLVDTLRRVDVPGAWALAAGVAYALLPGTVIYSLWVYVTSPLALFTLAAVWGVAVMRRSPVPGAAVSAAAMLLLLMFRPSFAWFVLVAWCAILVVLLLRRRSQARIGLGIGLVSAAAVAGLAVQAHYLVAFGLPVMSSWSGENLAKALRTSNSLVVTPEAEAVIRQDPCQSQMLDAYREDRLNRWDDAAFRGLPACAVLPGLAPRGTAAWDSPVKGDTGQPNYNYSDRLVASRQWTRMMTTIVTHDPSQLVRMALTTEYGPRSSGLGLYLSPSEDYPFVREVRDALPTAVPFGVLSILWGPALWALVIVGVVRAAAFRSSALRRSAPFWLGAGLLAFHALANTLAEYSENMRFRAEVDALLLAVAVMALYDLMRRGEGEAA